MLVEKQIINNDLSSAFAGVISDDKKIIVLGKMSGKIYIYQYDSTNGNYKYNHSLTGHDSLIRHIEISKNHIIMVASTFGNNVYVYIYNG